MACATIVSRISGHSSAEKVEEITLAVDDLSRMRFAGQQLERQVPDPRKGRIEKFQATVGTVDRDTFVEIVEGFTLHLDQGVVRAFECEAVGNVFEGHQHAAEGVRRRHHPQSVAIGQVLQLLHGLDHGAKLTQALLFEFRVIRILRQAPFVPGRIQNIAHVGPAVQEALVHSPQGCVG